MDSRTRIKIDDLVDKERASSVDFVLEILQQAYGEPRGFEKLSDEYLLDQNNYFGNRLNWAHIRPGYQTISLMFYSPTAHQRLRIPMLNPKNPEQTVKLIRYAGDPHYSSLSSERTFNMDKFPKTFGNPKYKNLLSTAGYNDHSLIPFNDMTCGYFWEVMHKLFTAREMSTLLGIDIQSKNLADIMQTSTYRRTRRNVACVLEYTTMQRKAVELIADVAPYLDGLLKEFSPELHEHFTNSTYLPISEVATLDLMSYPQHTPKMRVVPLESLLTSSLRIKSQGLLWLPHIHRLFKATTGYAANSQSIAPSLAADMDSNFKAVSFPPLMVEIIRKYLKEII